jgi:hypothetical protein
MSCIFIDSKAWLNLVATPIAILCVRLSLVPDLFVLSCQLLWSCIVTMFGVKYDPKSWQNSTNRSGTRLAMCCPLSLLNILSTVCLIGSWSGTQHRTDRETMIGNIASIHQEFTALATWPWYYVIMVMKSCWKSQSMVMVLTMGECVHPVAPHTI